MSDQKEGILEIATWLQSPLGRYLLDWEQQCLDQAVADLFGFHALQLGWPQLDGLRANRMPQRWLAEEAGRAQLQCSFDELPFESGTLDLVLLPHTLEFAADPHHRLREAARVLRPEGRLLILGLNPASLWGLRQRVAPCLPSRGEFIGYWRLRDWLRLLSFDVPQARFGCYRPPLNREAWLPHWAFMDRRGPTWWPVFGAVYFIEAVKRVHGMRLVGLAKSNGRRRAAPAVALPSRTHRYD
ncbi:SAM-dependent methyltransferase [Inhella inkyongensis]|uniref:SAM-dependent methyltransferase n=1 Tax=Inhella inkyongensis TaxID=392593 RepID=A0A840S411_9BURK|nr:class I SAM-dependent methyltransferase [Inhella inkyongensis]MBB5203786.1 SAM-dependent methyltransferase [Inhella inkyongensis]